MYLVVQTWLHHVGVGKNPWNPTLPIKSVDPFVRPPAREHIYGRIRLMLFFLFGFWTDNEYWVFGWVDTWPARPSNNTYIKIKKNPFLTLVFPSHDFSLSISRSPLSLSRITVPLSPSNRSRHTSTLTDSTIVASIWSQSQICLRRAPSPRLDLPRLASLRSTSTRLA